MRSFLVFVSLKTDRKYCHRKSYNLAMPLSTQVDLSKTTIAHSLSLGYLWFYHSSYRDQNVSPFVIDPLFPQCYWPRLRAEWLPYEITDKNFFMTNSRIKIFSFRIIKSVSEVWSRHTILSKWRLTAKNLRKIFVSPVGATSILFVVKLSHGVM